MTETGTLPSGAAFELRPQRVRDTVDIFDNPALAERAQKNNQFFAACLYAGRIIRLGDIPKEAITPEFILDMEQDDYNEIIAAGERLEQRMATFRGKAPADPDGNAGAAEIGLSG